jgi:NDP-sugar pyrophosphorylase family protein
MILAAGRGERLRPLTDRIPKALIEVGGVPMLERVAQRLIEAGAQRLIINLCHGAEAIEGFVTERGGFGVEVVFSRESPEPFETGGGVLHAAPHFISDAPFLLHNVDILTDLDLAALYETHLAGGRSQVAGDQDRASEDQSHPVRQPIATLAVARRETSRPLLVDEAGVYGRANRTEGWEVVSRLPGTGAGEVGFAGVHALSPRIFECLRERGAFSITDSYMRLIAEGERIGVFDVTNAYWQDVGTAERLERARARIGDSEPGSTSTGPR